MPGLRVLVILVSVIVLTEGQNDRGSPPQFLGRRIPYDLLVYFGNEATTQPPTTTTPATTTTTAATTTAVPATSGSDVTTGASVTTETPPTVQGPESSDSTVAETTATAAPTTADVTTDTGTTAPPTVTTDTGTTAPPTSTNVESTAPSTTQTTQPNTGPGIMLMADTGTGTVTTSTAERVSTGATSPGNPGASQASAQSTAGGAESTGTSVPPEITTGLVTPDFEELRRNLTNMLIPIYNNMPAYVSVEALEVTPYNFTQAKSNEMLGYRGIYRLELDAANVTNCLATNPKCNITTELLKRNEQVANLSLGGFPVHQNRTTAALFTFIQQESSKSLGTACQAGQPCLSYGPRYTCRLNQTAGAVSCHDVCAVPNYCDGGTCLSNNVENGTKMCRCPDQTVHNGHTCLNWWIVIGPSIGGAALLLIMIFVVIGLAVKLGRTDPKTSLKPSPSFTDSLRRYEMVGGQENRAYTPDPTLQDAASPQTFKYETPGTTPGASAPGPTEAATLPLADRGQPQDKAPANGVANGRSSLEMQDYPYQPSGAPPSRTYAQEVEEIMQSEAAKNFYPKLDHIDPKQDYSIRRPQLNTGTSYGDQVARF